MFLNRADDNLWIWDLENSRDTRLTETDGVDFFPAWRDDNTVTFATDEGDGLHVYSIPTDRGSEKEMTISTYSSWPGSWTPDGEILIYGVRTDPGIGEIWWQPVGGDPIPFLDTSDSEQAPRLSPDGQRLAYISDETGEDRIYVQAFPEGGEPVRISDEPGTEPVWSRDGRELFYRTGNQMVAVAVETEPAFRVVSRLVLFDEPYEFGFGGIGMPGYDVALDGEHFLMVQRDTDAAAGYTVVTNWLEELERLVPMP